MIIFGGLVGINSNYKFNFFITLFVLLALLLLKEASTITSKFIATFPYDDSFLLYFSSIFILSASICINLGDCDTV